MIKFINFVEMDSPVYTVNEYIELMRLHALAIRAKENRVPKFEDKVIKRLPKKILKNA